MFPCTPGSDFILNRTLTRKKVLLAKGRWFKLVYFKLQWFESQNESDETEGPLVSRGAAILASALCFHDV